MSPDPPVACPRCQGRLLKQGLDGDRACFNCGHVAYGLPPVSLPDQGRRMPSHGGYRLN